MSARRYTNVRLIILCMMGIMCSISVARRDKESQAILFDASSIGCAGGPFREISSFRTAYNRRIAIIKDGAGNKFVVKQDVRDDACRQVSAIRDVVAAEMAQLGEVPANRVLLIPAGFQFPGKLYPHLPATLHTFAPGILVKLLPKEEKNEIYIHQSVKPNVAKKERGLNMRVVKSMATNKTLPPIVACDTFIANGDRHHQNYFFDREEGKKGAFHAIDMESSFDKDLAFFACKFINNVIREEVLLTNQELEALKSYRDVLRRLLKIYTPESMYARLVELTIKSGIMTRKKQIKLTRNYLDRYENTIHKNYASCRRLLPLLDKLFKKCAGEK